MDFSLKLCGYFWWFNWLLDLKVLVGEKLNAETKTEYGIHGHGGFGCLLWWQEPWRSAVCRNCLVLVIPLLTTLGNWTWTVCTQGLYLVYHLNWDTFKSESRWFSYQTRLAGIVGTPGQTRLYFYSLSGSWPCSLLRLRHSRWLHVSWNTYFFLWIWLHWTKYKSYYFSNMKNMSHYVCHFEE